MLIILKQAEAELGQAQVCNGFIQKYTKQDDLFNELFDELQGVLKKYQNSPVSQKLL